MKPPPKGDKPQGADVSKSESSVRRTLAEAKAPAAEIVSQSLTTVPMEINAMDVVSQAIAKAIAVKMSHTPRGPREQPGESESSPKRSAPKLSEYVVLESEKLVRQLNKFVLTPDRWTPLAQHNKQVIYNRVELWNPPSLR